MKYYPKSGLTGIFNGYRIDRNGVECEVNVPSLDPFVKLGVLVTDPSLMDKVNEVGNEESEANNETNKPEIIPEPTTEENETKGEEEKKEESAPKVETEVVVQEEQPRRRGRRRKSE